MRGFEPLDASSSLAGRIDNLAGWSNSMILDSESSEVGATPTPAASN